MSKISFEKPAERRRRGLADNLKYVDRDRESVRARARERYKCLRMAFIVRHFSSGEVNCRVP